MSEQGEAFAKYHEERASYGGASREFHERALTFCLHAEAAARADERAKVLAEVERELLSDGIYDFDSVQEFLSPLK